MRGRIDALRALGADLAFVGTGTPAMARAFADEHAPGCVVLCDPTRVAFARAGMRRGLRALLRPRFVANAWRALRAGFRQGRVQGDPWQLGGVLVLAGGQVAHAQCDTALGDPLDIGALLAVAAAIQARRSARNMPKS